MESSALASAESWLSFIAVAKLVAAFLVAAGVVIEFGGDWLARPYENVVKEAREAQAKDAEQKIAEANARALEAQAALNKFKAQRTLTVPQLSVIANKILPFAGTNFDLAVGAGDVDGEMLLVPVESALLAAHWKEVEWEDKTLQPLKYVRPDKPNAGMVTGIGVIIEVDNAKISEFGPAATTLAAALNTEGIAAVAVMENRSTAANKNAVHILIGWKPR